MDTAGGGRGGTNGEAALACYNAAMCERTQLVGSCRMTQGAQPAQRAAMGGKQGQEEGMYLWLTHVFVWRNRHDIVSSYPQDKKNLHKFYTL